MIKLPLIFVRKRLTNSAIWYPVVMYAKLRGARSHEEWSPLVTSTFWVIYGPNFCVKPDDFRRSFLTVHP